MFPKNRSKSLHRSHRFGPWFRFHLEARSRCHGWVKLDFMLTVSKLAGVACTPVIISKGFIRLVSHLTLSTELCNLIQLSPASRRLEGPNQHKGTRKVSSDCL